MRKDVYISANKTKASFKVIDLKSNEPWANEKFKTNDEAVEFCKDNKLKIHTQPILKKEMVFDFPKDEHSQDLEVEDGGQAMITYLTEQSDDDNGMFIRIQSWDENKEHKEFKTFMGRKVKITIETID